MKRLDLKPGAVSRARELRRDASPVERSFWRALRQSFPHIHFRRQAPLGSYYADFASHAYKLIIELDGDSHAYRQNHDEARTRFLEAEGYKVVRFANNEVMRNISGVMESLKHFFDLTPTPNPSPHGGGVRSE